MFQVRYPSADSAQNLVDDVCIVLVPAQPSLDSLGSAPGEIVSVGFKCLLIVYSPLIRYVSFIS